jgi:hypothetical protein
MGHSSLGYSFIESTDKIKEKLKPKKATNALKKTKKEPLPSVEESNTFEEIEEDTELANIDFSPPPKPESIGAIRTEEKEIALNHEHQHPSYPHANIANEFAADYQENNEFLPNMNDVFRSNTSQVREKTSNSSELERKLNYMIHLLEDQKDERVEGITEEIVLYCFLGVFIIFVLDSFAKVGKYVR